ncbi:hypothetical protein Cpar_0889 [Chlorobaculum parvum NCIB 8327]|uniref:Uncharacterized protein n=1 Tax=Chlorobaculum parvum (strain DSM 263 / NCIMB 8327) TaxID=517417 RepID=B3QMZ9_CHLP8|nr:contractile injection system tape measure protein [Chlorobaculum parvum]ACF11302.1 hypothetical protein Cpar_0889 [Chlorobaculum parvum NCIB 8327]
MATGQRHTIVRHTLDVRFNGSKAGAASLQTSLSELCRQSITAALEPVLDRYTVDGSVLKIDKLEIDAGSLHLDQLDERFPAMIAEALDNALGKVATAGQAMPTETHEQQTGSRIPETESAVDALLFFLRHGTLPSTFRPQSHEAFETQLREAFEQPDLAAQATKELMAPTARQRLLLQFSRPVAIKLLERLTPAALPVIDELTTRGRNAGLPASSIISIEQKLLDRALSIAANRNNTPPEEVRQALLSVAITIPEVVKSDLIATHGDQTATKPRSAETPSKPQTTAAEMDVAKLSETVKTAQTQSGRQKSEPASPGSETPAPESQLTGNRSETTGKPSDASSDPALTSHKKDSGTTRTEPAQAVAAERDTMEKAALETVREHPDERNGLYVENAGLVLLHPFLPQFFSALKVAGDKELLQPDRALQLLHFLATGSENVPEYELVLPKILCGLAPASLAGKADTLSDEEKEESEALLSAVTRHWDVLKNTGIDALRETYLKRNGKLTRWYDGGWLIQVESKSFDILLESLPWGISMIKLPWMPHMLRVEWFGNA